MNRVLKYRGKTIKEMTLNELEEQYKINKLRFIYRTIFFGLIAISMIFYEPISSFIPVTLAIITDYWLIENNKLIKQEIVNSSQFIA